MIKNRRNSEAYLPGVIGLANHNYYDRTVTLSKLVIKVRTY